MPYVSPSFVRFLVFFVRAAAKAPFLFARALDVYCRRLLYSIFCKKASNWRKWCENDRKSADIGADESPRHCLRPSRPSAGRGEGIIRKFQRSQKRRKQPSKTPETRTSPASRIFSAPAVFWSSRPLLCFLSYCVIAPAARRPRWRGPIDRGRRCCPGRSRPEAAPSHRPPCGR